MHSNGYLHAAGIGSHPRTKAAGRPPIEGEKLRQFVL